jgi:predicted dehydrogenase
VLFIFSLSSFFFFGDFMKHCSRRNFLKTVAAASPFVFSAAALGKDNRIAPSERIGMATIGCGGQGRGDMGNLLNFKEVQMLAVCDPVPEHRAEAKQRVDNHYKNKDCTEYVDFRDVLERPDIDAVLIATPDHWHATITIAAAKKGIDVYCEKPENLTIREGRRVIDTVKKYGIVFSGGSQRVIGDYGDIPRLLWGGAIGEIKEAYVDCGGPPRDCDLPEQPTPEGINWDLWIGPAPWRPFHRNLILGGFRDFRDYSGGGMTDWGCHRFGAAMFATQKYLTGPVEVQPGEKNDERRLTYLFADGMKMYHAHRGDNFYEGTD